MRVSYADQSLSFANSASRVRIKAWDYLLIIGFCFAPMTGFRTGKVGPGEVLCLIWCMKQAISFKVSVSETSKFFLGFVIAIIFGTICGTFITPDETKISRITTWLYLGLIAIFVYDSLLNNTYEYNEKLFFVMAAAAVIWQYFLYQYSMNVSRTFWGSPLWYANKRYSGGGTNPHQVAVMLCGLQFVFLRRIVMKKTVLPSILLAWACYYIMRKTEAATGMVAIVLGALSFLYLWAAGRSRWRGQILVILSLLLIALVVIFFDKIYQFVIDWIHEDRNGQGRLNLISEMGRVFPKSPIFGLGLGMHANNGRQIEFHNTYLEILAATGIFGTSIFALYTARIIKKLFNADSMLIPTVVAIYAYGTAGFAMRRLVYWIILCFVLAVAQTKKRDELIMNHSLPN